MPEKTGSLAYLCECGKKWIIEKATLQTDTTWKCKCGRSVVVRGGAVYTTSGK